MTTFIEALQERFDMVGAVVEDECKQTVIVYTEKVSFPEQVLKHMKVQGVK